MINGEAIIKERGDDKYRRRKEKKIILQLFETAPGKHVMFS